MMETLKTLSPVVLPLALPVGVQWIRSIPAISPTHRVRPRSWRGMRQEKCSLMRPYSPSIRWKWGNPYCKRRKLGGGFCRVFAPSRLDWSYIMQDGKIPVQRKGSTRGVEHQIQVALRFFLEKKTLILLHGSLFSYPEMDTLCHFQGSTVTFQRSTNGVDI